MPYKDPERQKKAQHESYLRNKKQVYDRRDRRKRNVTFFLTKKKSEIGCKICGEKRGPALSFHHRNGEDKLYEIGDVKLLAKKKLFEEIEKCDIICANCHMLLHWNEKENGREDAWLFEI